MSVKKAGYVNQNSGARINMIGPLLCAIVLLVTCHPSLVTAALAAEKWSGVDESVIEKYAKEHGREAREPLINPDQGDLLLFVFLLAGSIGGFMAGYYWRVLSERKTRDRE